MSICKWKNARNNANKQGLPPRLGIVPHSAIADEEKRIEEEQEQETAPQQAPEAHGERQECSQGKSHD